MRAETVSVGTEILLGQITDTNAVALGQAFARCGIDHTHRQTVGDNLERLTAALRLALSRADIVVTIGGLGPTEDDLTRDGIAAALDSPLVLDPALEARLREIFAQRRLVWLDAQLRQAKRPESSVAIPNPNGTAPGLHCTKGGKTVFAMPGPSAEFLPMLDAYVAPELARLGGGQTILSRTLKITGMGESVVEEKLRDLMAANDPTVAPYAKTGEVQLRLTTKSGDMADADQRLQQVETQIRERLGLHVYGSGDDTLEGVVIELLKKNGATLATAESCTGGWVGQRLTSVPGSSEAYVGGVVSYSNELKQALLGVRAETLERHGAVSAECAEEMALGAKSATGADYAVSVTGVAGPGGGTENKPVGLVYIGVSTPSGLESHRFEFPGKRDTVRLRSVVMALSLLRNALLDR